MTASSQLLDLSSTISTLFGRMASVSDDLKLAASLSLQQLVNNGKLYMPISASHLLRKLVALGPLPPSTTSLRLTDLHKLEAILEEFAVQWDVGALSIIRDDNEVSLIHASCNASCLPPSKKRKREPEIDEDADSAEENESKSETQARTLSTIPMSGLSMETREIYGLLQKGTARGRLLAEQVC